MSQAKNNYEKARSVGWTQYYRIFKTLRISKKKSQGRMQEFWKGGPGKGAKPQTECRRRECRRGVWEPPPENCEKLDAIFCNLAYIFGIRMASDIIQNWACAEQKTVAAMISKPTDIRF